MARDTGGSNQGHATTIGPADLANKCDEFITIVAVSDVHGIVDPIRIRDPRGQKYVGGIDGIAATVEFYRRVCDLIGEDLYVFAVGDMIAKYRDRRIWDSTGVTAWHLIVGDSQNGTGAIGAYGATFGNHEMEFRDVPGIEADNIHCHNLEMQSGTANCPPRNPGPHRNAACCRAKGAARGGHNPPRVRYCGVTCKKQDSPSGATARDPDQAATECPHHWDELGGESLRILLAHYNPLGKSSSTLHQFQKIVPDGYDVILRAHDHHGGHAPRQVVKGTLLPTVVEPLPNGRSIAVLRVGMRNGKIAREEFLQHGVAGVQGKTAWSVRQGFPEETTPTVYERDFFPFGGATNPPRLAQRRRAAQLALRGMRHVHQSADHRVFLIAATAIRDDAFVPGPGRDDLPIDVWDIRHVFANETIEVFEVETGQLLDALDKMLHDPPFEPCLYKDQARLFVGIEHKPKDKAEDKAYEFTLDDDGNLLTRELSGPDCLPAAPQLRLADLLPRSNPHGNLYAVMPHFEAKRFCEHTGITAYSAGKRRGLCVQGMHKCRVSEAICALLKTPHAGPHLFRR